MTITDLLGNLFRGLEFWCALSTAEGVRLRTQKVKVFDGVSSIQGLFHAHSEATIAIFDLDLVGKFKDRS